MTGLLLAGIGVSLSTILAGRARLTTSQHVTTGADSQKNFLVVDNKTETSTIESTFDRFIERKDIAIVLINQHVSLPGHLRKSDIGG